MEEVNYSHDTVWLLLHSLPIMDYSRKNEPRMWRKFMELVADETAQGYPDTWNTPFTINKIASDLGSYKLLLDIWLQVEEAMPDVYNPIYK